MKVLDSFSLKGKVALITGGAGKYGKQITSALAEAGATTYMASRNLEALEKEAQEYRKKGYDVSALQYDQGDEQSMIALRDEIVKRSGKIDVLVNNSVARIINDMDEPAEKFEQSMKINSTGLFLMCRTFGETMAAQEGGSIINIGSIYGMVGFDPSLYEGTGMKSGSPAYYFEKAGMINFTRFLGSYYGEHNVRCNCVSPGGFYTPGLNETFHDRYKKKTFLGRMANSSDIKGVIVFLASDASAYITGANIPVDGGLTAK